MTHDADRSSDQSSDRSSEWVRDYDRVAAAIGWLDTHPAAQPRVEELASALHLSAGHLHRTLVRFAGVSPQRFLRWLTLGAAKVLLRERASLLDTVVATDLSSRGRLHDLAVNLEGVTPELARGGSRLTIRFAAHATPLGSALIAVTERGVLSLRFLDPHAGAAAALEALRGEWPQARLVEDPTATRTVVDHLAVRFDHPGGRERSAVVLPPLPVLAVGTDLQVRVWEALLLIPEHRVVTYAEVARAVGRPGAARPVANAVGRNPVAALIPCHRVLRSTGELGGYRWGTTRKRALLAREAARDADA